MHENEYKLGGSEKYDDIIYETEDNTYESVNYYEINESESKIEANSSEAQAHYYLEMNVKN